MNVGVFIDEIEAAHAFDAFAITNSIDVPLNFPVEEDANEMPLSTSDAAVSASAPAAASHFS
jgi:hypothetical protein